MFKSALSAISLSLLMLVAVVPAATADTVQDTRTFFLANTGTACGPDANYQLFTSARTGGPNCGYIGGLPFGEVFSQIGDDDFGTNIYTAAEGAPFVLDATTALEGQITVIHASGTTGVGQVAIDITVRGRNGSSSTTLASGTVEQLVTGDLGTSTIPFSLDIADAQDAKTFTGLTMSVNVRGLHANTGYTSSQGDSFFTLPILVEDETV